MSDALLLNPSATPEPPSPDAGSGRTEAPAEAPLLPGAASAGAALQHEAEDRVSVDLPPLEDPYLRAPVAAPPPKLSRLAVSSVLLLLLGPVGAIAGIVFGWAARRAIESSGGRRRGYALATAGLLLGVSLTVLWGAGLTFLAWTLRYRTESKAVQEAEPARINEPRRARVPLPLPQTTAPEPQKAGFVVPKTTTTRRQGAITIVDVGVSAASLKEALAKERAEAERGGETLLLMTTGARCEPCQGFDASLADPLMQTALSHVRLVRVEVSTFAEDLEALKVPSSEIPGFFLLSLELTPRDGINGGEWDDDIARNIAPVLGAFVRGKYTSRRHAWKPLTGSGIRL